MSRIVISEPETTERMMPTFARNEDTGDYYIIHNTHNGKDAITWAVNMQSNGERVRYDPLDTAFYILPVGTVLKITV